MRPYLSSFLFLLIAVLISLAIGSVFLSLQDIFAALQGKGSDLATNILWNIRLPRTVLIALTGMALGGSGAAYQGLFRNPLADPYLIGIASGAGLGAVIAMSFDRPFSFVGLMAIPLAAFVFALLTVAIVYFLARVGQTAPITNLLLAGVAVSSFTTSLMSFIMLRTDGELRRAMSWLMGGSIQLGWEFVATILPYLLIGLGVLLFSGHVLNLLQFGDEQAQQLGLNVSRSKTMILIMASMATAVAVSFAGIIGFIGLIVPHLMRLWFGSDYRKLVPLSIICGATALLFSDVIARVVLAPQELPVGVVTSLAGAPFFLWVLRRSKTQGLW
jgi:iron complex transport system permease protein